jgi:hypothetical protein
LAVREAVSVKSRIKTYGSLPVLAVVLVASAVSPAYPADGVHVAHLHKLSDFSGTIPYSGVRLSVDRNHNEVYVIAGNAVRIYNEAGMEVYRFGDNPQLGRILDLAADETGDLFLLSYETSLPPGSSRPAYSLIRCDFRGEPREKIAVKDLPPEYAAFLPQLLFHREEGFLLVSRVQMLAVATDRNGTFLKGFDLADLVGVEEEKRPGTEIFGFSVDGRGNMLFTVPVLFQAFRVAPDGTISSFGKKGSSPGTFGVATGIVVDDHGHFLVSDSQRSVVMVFDEQFRFIAEFGTYGFSPRNLVRPRDLAVGNSGKIYIVQMRKQGVSVFSVTPAKLEQEHVRIGQREGVFEARTF